VDAARASRGPRLELALPSDRANLTVKQKGGRGIETMEPNARALPAAEAANRASSAARRKTTFMSPLVAVLCIVLMILILPPTIILFEISFRTTEANGAPGVLTLANYTKLFANRFFFSSLANTIVFAVGSAFVAITLGVSQALIVERTNAPGRRLVFLGAVISLGVPYVLYVVAWLLILGRSGPVNSFVQSLTGDPSAGFNVYSLTGMSLVEGVGYSPLTFLLMSSILRNSDAAFEEASMMSGARPLRTFWSISLRMGLPGVLALLLLVFIRAFESFEVPALVGLAGNINVLTTNIYIATHSSGVPDYGQSGAYAVCLLVIVAGLLYFYGRLSRNAHHFQSITGKGFRPRVIDLGRWKWACSGLLLISFLLVTALPLAMLVFTSLQPFYEGVTTGSFGRFTLDNYREMLAPGSFRDSIVNTLILGCSTATFVVPFTAVCAWLAARRRPGAWLLDQLATAPLVFPAIVLSVAFLYVFVNLPLPLYGTLLSVVLASSARYMPYGMRYSYAGVLQIHVDLEDASMSAGARRLRTFFKIVAPLLGPALISAWLFVFLLSVQAVSLPLLLVGPGTEIVAVSLFDLWQNGQVTELASMGVLWVALMIVVSSTFYTVTRRYGVAAG
jgi:iron(III) transport system permease protein